MERQPSTTRSQEGTGSTFFSSVQQERERQRAFCSAPRLSEPGCLLESTYITTWHFHRYNLFVSPLIPGKVSLEIESGHLPMSLASGRGIPVELEGSTLQPGSIQCRIS